MTTADESASVFEEQLSGLAALFDLAPWQVDVLRQTLLSPGTPLRIEVPFRNGITDRYAAINAYNAATSTEETP